jgi:hypothetical protein
VLDEHTVFEDADLRPAVLGTDDHLAVDRFTTREELGLGDDRTPATGIPSVATALLLRLEARRPLDRLGFGDVLDDALAGLARFVTLLTRLARLTRVDIVGTAATTTATAAGRLFRLALGDAVEHTLAAGARGKGQNLGGIEVQLRRDLRDEDLGEQSQGHSGEGPRSLRLFRSSLGSGLFGRGVGCRSLLSRSFLSRSLLGRSFLGRSLLSRSLLNRSLLNRSLLNRSFLGRGVLGRGVLSRGVLSRSLLSRGLSRGNRSGRTRAALRGVRRAVGLRSVGDYLCGCVSIRSEVEGRGVVVIVLIGHLWLAPRADTSCSANSHAAPAGAANSFGVRPAHGSDHEGHTAPKSASMPTTTGSSDASQAIIAPSASVRGIVGTPSRFLRRAHARYIVITETIHT